MMDTKQFHNADEMVNEVYKQLPEAVVYFMRDGELMSALCKRDWEYIEQWDKNLKDLCKQYKPPKDLEMYVDHDLGTTVYIRLEERL